MWEQRSAGGGTWKHRELRSEGGTAGREVVLLEWEGGGRGRRKEGNGMEVKSWSSFRRVQESRWSTMDATLVPSGQRLCKQNHAQTRGQT